MIKIQVNIGDNNRPQWRDVEEDDMVVFSNGYQNVNSGFTGIKRIIHEFNEVDTPYAKCCHLLSGGNIYQINYNAEQLFNAPALFLAHPDQSGTLSKFSFRVVFIDYIVDWIKTPVIYCRIPKFFYGNSRIDTLITPFFYTDEAKIAPGDILEIDEYRFLAAQVDQVATYKKVWVSPYDNTDLNITVDKEKYIIRDYNLHSVDTTLTQMPKVMFHDDQISLAMIPQVYPDSDITDTDLRSFRSTYEWASIDMSNYPFELDIDSTLDLSNTMMINDFTLTHNINTGDSVIYCLTAKNTEIKKGDYLLVKNNVWSEIFQVTDINMSSNSIGVNRPFKKYEFIANDPSIKVYWNKMIFFQPILLNAGENLVNYPVLFNFEVKYLNIA